MPSSAMSNRNAASTLCLLCQHCGTKFIMTYIPRSTLCGRSGIELITQDECLACIYKNVEFFLNNPPSDASQ